MAAIYTVDASVFVNAFNPFEDGHEDSARLLSLLRELAVPMIEPALLLPEVAAAVRRGRGDAELARAFATTVGRLPHLVLVPLDEPLAREAAGIAAHYSLRGSDATYAAVALRFGATLITLDREQRELVPGILPTRSPSEAVAERAQSHGGGNVS